MKLALLFLVCFAGMSYQQQHDYWYQLLQNKALFYDPYYFAYANEPHPYQLPTPSDARNPEDNQFRFRFGMRPQQKKFFSISKFPTGFTFFDGSRPVPVVTTSTSTEFATTVLTATIASVQSCIPSTLFITQLAVGGAVTSTSPCARKRRAIDDHNAFVSQSEQLSPSQLTFVESSTAPEIKLDDQPIDGSLFETTNDFEVVSSQREPSERQQYVLGPSGNYRTSAFLQPPRTLTITSTVIKTLTSYSFATTLIKRSIILSGPNALSCLPSAYAVC